MILTQKQNQITARPPETLAGLLEIRGQGVISVPWLEEVDLALVVDLVALSEVPRMPLPDELMIELHGIICPRLFLYPWQESAAARIRSFLVKGFSSPPKRR